MLAAGSINCSRTLRASASHHSSTFTLAAKRPLSNFLRLPVVRSSPRRLFAMAPKQATLGYVKSRQGTLGCVTALVGAAVWSGLG